MKHTILLLYMAKQNKSCDAKNERKAPDPFKQWNHKKIKKKSLPLGSCHARLMIGG